MTNLEIIKKLRESTFIDEDGESYQLVFQNGLTDSEIEAKSTSFPANRIDGEIVEILKETRGWDAYMLDAVYFDSIGEFGFSELSPNSLTLGHDGFGNFWILDLDSEGRPGKVFFACHDPAVLVIHSQSLNEYLHHLLEFHEQPSDCHLNRIHDGRCFEIWKENPNCNSKVDFAKDYPEFADFLSQFEGDEWTVADLRGGKNGDGFAWGKFGANQLTARHSTALVWVMKNKPKGFSSRLFGA